ncbi:hypothetical protein [Streptomyces sp. NBC_00234]|uniref:hypothetical protein n=1 Tax=Streptomyces sp. NBC_00234 TaxID=2903638 RepID=UPI002E2AA546|nr:hypothetical protein [Streptomyces sp. NBC_00234]
MLIQQLPRDSGLSRELNGEVADWSVTDYLLAHTVDQLQEANWMFATVNRDEESDPLPRPVPVPRPLTDPSSSEEEGQTELVAPTASELMQFFN